MASASDLNAGYAGSTATGVTEPGSLGIACEATDSSDEDSWHTGDVWSTTKTVMLRLVSVRGAAVAAWTITALAAPTDGTLPSLLSPGSSGGRVAVTTGLWVICIMTLAALLLPGPRALTVTRIAIPAGGVIQLWALATEPSWEAATLVAAVAGLAGALIVLLPAHGEAQVDAAGYGDERRYLLRPPGPVLVALMLPLWGVSVVGAMAGPLLLAHSRWAAGAVASLVGLPAAAVAAHTLFRLACRWLVFVPNGLVIHDHLTVASPLPLPRRGITSLGPAPADTAAADLTAQAFGMALELRLAHPLQAPVRSGRKHSEEQSLAAILVTPSRPAAVMATAERRGTKLA